MTNLEQILAAVDQLSPDEREKLRMYLENSAKSSSAGKKWLAQFDAALDEFWADTSDAEQAEILKAIETKSAAHSCS